MAEIKNEVEYVIKTGRVVVEKRQVDFPDKLNAQLDAIKQQYNELGGLVRGLINLTCGLVHNFPKCINSSQIPYLKRTGEQHKKLCFLHCPMTVWKASPEFPQRLENLVNETGHEGHCDQTWHFTNFVPELYQVCAPFTIFSIGLENLHFPTLFAKYRECKLCAERQWWKVMETMEMFFCKDALNIRWLVL